MRQAAKQHVFEQFICKLNSDFKIISI